MALVSPGLQITVTDESQYLPTALGTVPFVLLATAENKTIKPERLLQRSGVRWTNSSPPSVLS